MADKKTGIKLQISAVDKTARAFKKIASRATAITTSIAKWGAAAGAVAVGAFAIAAKQLGKLSDIAQSAATTTDELTKLSAALDMLGIKGSAPEELAMAFQRMTKATGAVGLKGFHNIVEQISQLATAQERAAAAQKVFGRTGLQFLPLIEAVAKGGIGSLEDLEAGMARIPQKAAEAGDAAADAMSHYTGSIKQLWFEAVGAICEDLDSEFEGGTVEAAMVGAAHMKYFARVAGKHIMYFIKNAGKVFEAFGTNIAQWAKNIGIAVGGILTTTGENAMRVLSAYLEGAGTGALAFIEHMVNGMTPKFYDLAHKAANAIPEALKENQENWNKTFDLLGGMKWNIVDPFEGVDTSKEKELLRLEIEAAKKAAEARKKLSDGMKGTAAFGNLDFGGSKARGKIATNPEALLGGTYKAVTYAMRAGYAKGEDKVVGEIRKSNGFLKAMKENTDYLPNLLKFGEL